MLTAVVRNHPAREPSHPRTLIAKISKQISVPLISTRASGQAGRPGRIQRLKNFRQGARYDDLVHSLGRQVGDDRTLGFIHSFDFVEVVVHGASILAVDRERLASALARVEDRSIY